MVQIGDQLHHTFLWTVIRDWKLSATYQPFRWNETTHSLTK